MEVMIEIGFLGMLVWAGAVAWDRLLVSGGNLKNRILTRLRRRSVQRKDE